MVYDNTTNELVSAVREGNIERVRDIISTFGLSFSEAWAGGCNLLCDAILNNHRDITKLLLFWGSKTNSNNKLSDTPLHFATEHGDVEIIQMLIDRGADVNAMNMQYTRPLHIAVKKEQKEIVDLLINNKADINAINRFLQSPLYLAIESGNEEIAWLLLRKGANARTTGPRNKTPLHSAAAKGYFEIVKHLIQRGANVNSVSTKCFTPLHLAIKNGHENIVKLLLECKANIDIEYSDHKTTLYIAVQKGDPIIIDHILRHSPDLNNKCNRKALKVALDAGANTIVEKMLQYGFTLLPEDANNSKLLYTIIENGYSKILEGLFKDTTDDNVFRNSTFVNDSILLHMATKYRQQEIVKLLIRYGADVNAPNKTGHTPIHYAVKNADLEITKLLLNNGADVKDNRLILHIAVRQNLRDIVEVLLEHGIRVDTRDKYGATALHWTILNKNAELSKSCVDKDDPDINVKAEIAGLLLSRGANANTRITKDMTILHAAASIGNAKMVEALLEHNVDVDSTCGDDRTALHVAAKAGNEVMCQILLDKGANINAKRDDGRAALHIATEKGREKVVELLLKCGAKINCKSKIGTTLLHVAAEKNYPEIVKLFIKFGADIDSQNQYGVTALHIACKFGYVEVVKTLLDHSADITIKTRTGWTAIAIAMAGIDYFYSKNPDDFKNGDGYCAHEHILELLDCHAMKLKTAYLQRRNQDLLLLNDYEEEIARLKSRKLDANISFFNIFTNGIS